MSRQPKKGWVGNQNESESTTESADSATLSRQLRKRWVGNQKSAIFGNQKPKSSKIEAVAPFEGSSLWVGN